MQYIMALYELNSNATLVEPLRNKTSGEMMAAHQNLEGRLKEGGVEPKLHTVDNKISVEYKEAISNSREQNEISASASQ